MQVHTYVIAAYKHSPFLEQCLESVAQQTMRSSIIVSTSTPFTGLEAICRAYGAKLRVHGPNRGIGADWNAALQCSSTPLVTIAHQDDVYSPSYTDRICAAHQNHPSHAIYFCDGGEIREDGSPRIWAANLIVKRALIGIASAGSPVIAGKVRPRLLLGFGNPITCPAVTFNTMVVGDFTFREDMRTNMDWIAWIELIRQGGAARIPDNLVRRRIHDLSATSACLGDGTRSSEDQDVFQLLWPKKVAAILATIYQLSYRGYMN